MNEVQRKPATIIVGVQGIESSAVVNTPSEPQQNFTDWAKLAYLPPFEMFVSEMFQIEAAYMYEFLDRRRSRYELDDLYLQYANWHTAKGYWPKEDPLGRLIE